jgi:uncharacterized protein
VGAGPVAFERRADATLRRRFGKRSGAPLRAPRLAARIAVGTVEIHLPDVGSLKGKRHVLKGLKDRLRRRFEIAVAEVDHQDSWQRATLGLACVSASARHANEVI